MTILITVDIILLAMSYFLSDRDLFSPGVLCSSVWLFVICLFALFGNHLPPLSNNFILCNMLWTAAFCIGAWSSQSVSYNVRYKESGSKMIKDIFFIISICCIPLLYRYVTETLATIHTGSWALDLRYGALGFDINMQPVKEAYSPFYYYIWLATYILYLVDIDKKHWLKAAIMGALLIAFAFCTMAKLILLEFGFITLFILYQKHILRAKHILIGLAAILTLMVALNAIRSSTQVDGEQVSNIFEDYVLCSLAAFDTLSPASTHTWGENTFRIYYAIMYKLGFSNTAPVATILPWITKPVFTNTYTCMYPFYVDFGNIGVCIFALVSGLFYGWVYKKHICGSIYFTALYAYLCYSIVMQFDSELIITNLSGTIKFAMLLMIAYLASHYRLFIVSKKTDE